MKTKRKPYKAYTREFKLEAVRLMKETDREEMGSSRLLHNTISEPHR